MKTILPIILSYNQPDDSDKIYQKLLKDGFEKIILVDNGSDQKKPAKYANFLLPWNIKFAGQARIVLTYAMDYFPADYYWLITTSVQLQQKVNYLEGFRNTISDLKEYKIASISPSIISKKAPPTQDYNRKEDPEKYSVVFHPEMVAPLVNHYLLDQCRRTNISYFDKNYKRGWGMDYEFHWQGLKNDFYGFITFNIPVKWLVNKGYKNGLGGEAVSIYKKKAFKEMDAILSSRYGDGWYEKMYFSYLSKAGRKFKDKYFDETPDRPNVIKNNKFRYRLNKFISNL